MKIERRNWATICKSCPPWPRPRFEDAIAARGAPVWFQLYTTQRWEVAEGLVKRAEAAGAPVIAVTLDVRSPAKWETFARLRRTDTRDCGSCHGLNCRASPNFIGIDLGGVSRV